MMKRCTLEMGGNDAAIVRADCEVDGAIDGLFMGAFMNSGQVSKAGALRYNWLQCLNGGLRALNRRAIL